MLVLVTRDDDDVVYVAGLNNHRGIAVGHPLITHGRAPRRLITVVAAKEVPAGKLGDALGIREVSYTKAQSALALKERTLQ